MIDAKVPLAALIGKDPLEKRNRAFLWGGLIVAALSVGSSFATGFDPIKAISSIPASLGWIGENFVPDQKAFARLPNILSKLWITIAMSVSSSVIAAVPSFLLALAGSRTTSSNAWVRGASRFVASLLRNIPVAAWALVFLFSFGQSDFTGFLSLFLASLGFLSRVFMEVIDETSASSVEALEATGATRAQVIFQAVLPDIAPQAISWVLFTIETNIRSATLVGMLTGTGIGFLFTLYYRYMDYKSAALVVMGIVVVVLVIEALSNAARKVVL